MADFRHFHFATSIMLQVRATGFAPLTRADLKALILRGVSTPERKCISGPE